jgi:hypothetical protein
MVRARRGVGFSKVLDSRWAGDGQSAGGAGQCGQAVECGREFMSPGPARCYPNAEAAAAPGDPGGGVQDPVAEFSRFGSREFRGARRCAPAGSSTWPRTAACVAPHHHTRWRQSAKGWGAPADESCQLSYDSASGGGDEGVRPVLPPAGHPSRASSPAPATGAGPRPTPRPSCPSGTGAAVRAGQPRCRTRARGNHTSERPSWTARPSTRKAAAQGPPVALWIRHPRAVQEAPSSCSGHDRITRPGIRVRPPPLKIEKTIASYRRTSVSRSAHR